MHNLGKAKLIFHECVEQFPDDDMCEDLVETHDKTSLVLSPVWFGYPVSRPRRYTLLWDKQAFQIKSKLDIDALMQQFGRKCVMDADSFYIAPARAKPSTSLTG